MLNDKTIMPFVSTTDPARAREFYENVLGLLVKSQDNYAIVYDANGIDLRMSTVRELVVAPYSVLSWIVPDIKAEVIELGAKGVQFEKYGFFEQDELNIWTAPGGTQVCWFKDPDGNLLSLTQYV